MIETGGIYRATPKAAKRSALVLVTGIDRTTDEAAVTLLSPDVELGSSSRPSAGR